MRREGLKEEGIGGERRKKKGRLRDEKREERREEGREERARKREGGGMG